MYMRKTIICNATGLHARPASNFMNVAKQFHSHIQIGRASEPEKLANAKSILMVLSLALAQSTPIIICAEGEDEKEAVDTLISLIDSGFGET